MGGCALHHFAHEYSKHPGKGLLSYVKMTESVNARLDYIGPAGMVYGRAIWHAIEWCIETKGLGKKIMQ